MDAGVPVDLRLNRAAPSTLVVDLNCAFASKTRMPVLMPRSRASRDEETMVAASVA